MFMKKVSTSAEAAMSSEENEVQAKENAVAEESGGESTNSDPTGSAKGDVRSVTSSSNDFLSTGDAKAVRCSKILVYLALIMVTTIMGTLTYFFISSEETANIKDHVRTALSQVS